MMSFQLPIFNPAWYWRKGHITVPWRPIYEATKISPGELIMKQVDHVLPVQIDPIDPLDPSSITLAFSLVYDIEPGDENYLEPSAMVSIERGKPTMSHEHEPQFVVHKNSKDQDRGVTLINDHLILFFNLTPELEEFWETKCYAGAITSYKLHDHEMLDAFNCFDPMKHDPEKRLQIQSVTLERSPWEESFYQKVNLFDRPYELISISSGPVRACFTVASESFDYSYTDPETELQHHVECRLYRTISLYANADYLVEELWVKGKLPEHKSVDMGFTCQYFADMDLSFFPTEYRFARVPDWLAIGYPNDFLDAPHPGYGFATDVHTASYAHPHPNFPNPSKDYKTFSWSLQPSKSAKCLHFFMWGHPGGFDDKSGQYWYDLIYKPLKASVNPIVWPKE